MEPPTGLTLGLVFFAGVQVWIMHRTEERLRAERKADKADAALRAQRDEDVLFQYCYAEHFRIWSLAKRYQAADVVELAVFRLLRAEDVLPSDPGALTERLARLSPEAGYLGAMAVSWAQTVASSIAAFCSTVESLCAESQATTRAQALAHVRTKHGDQLRPHADRLRQGVLDVSQMLWDALRHSSAADRERRLEFKDDVSSELTKGLIAELARRGK